MPFLDTHSPSRRRASEVQAKRKRTTQGAARVEVIDVTDENDQPSNTSFNFNSNNNTNTNNNANANANANVGSNDSDRATKRRRSDHRPSPASRTVEVITIDDDQVEEEEEEKRKPEDRKTCSLPAERMAPAPTPTPTPVPPTPPNPPAHATNNSYQHSPMMEQLESNDYFQVLGLTRSATEADVKKAYRKLALQWHPDKNPGNAKAEEYFKKIAEAYEVLSDPERRKVYERYGKDGLNGTGGDNAGAGAAGYYDHFGFGGRSGFSSRHAFDIFEAFFGGADPFEELFGGGSGRRRSSRPRQREDDWDSFGFGAAQAV
ncbi:hypothetical protein P43SY_001909 [Pythium insidiosum]|uniref:J domain-containing protein n=1 Tax=Pythium insidiosum TaxID=114742 RepID=A0AAD5LDM4_PYTIN|nr:hypothetical protein P43SY_001909 [Pythium insidiosum]